MSTPQSPPSTTTVRQPHRSKRTSLRSWTTYAALRDATRPGVDMLAPSLRRATSRARWRKLLTYRLGGTVIVAANGLGTALLEPAGIAASQVIGSAAVRVAAALLD
jgi:hypothetical protein